MHWGRHFELEAGAARVRLGTRRPNVTGEGQKTSSVLSRALSRIEMKIQAETIRLSDRSLE